MFEAKFPGPFVDGKAAKAASAGSKIFRILQEELHKMSGGRSKLHHFDQFADWLFKDLRGARAKTKRKNVKGLHADIETQTMSFYQGAVSGGKRCTKQMLEEFAEKALRKKLENGTAKFGNSWCKRFMGRHGIRERVVKRQVKLSDDQAKVEIQKFHDHLQSVLATGQVKWICNLVGVLSLRDNFFFFF